MRAMNCTPMGLAHVLRPGGRLSLSLTRDIGADTSISFAGLIDLSAGRCSDRNYTADRI